MNKIQKFIKDNDLNLEDTGSGFNSTCAILAGYACYLYEDIDPDRLFKEIEENKRHQLTSWQKEELEKVYCFALDNSYERYWETADGQREYIYDLKE